MADIFGDSLGGMTQAKEQVAKAKEEREAKRLKDAAESRTRKDEADERQQKAQERADLYEEGQETGLTAAKTAVEGAQAAPVIGMAAMSGAGDPNLDPRQRAAMLQQGAQESQASIAKAQTALGEEQVRVAEEQSEVGGDPLAAEAERDAADYASEIAGTWDKNLEERFSGTWNDDEKGAYNHHMDQLDAKVKEIWGSSFRYGEGKALFNKIKALSTGGGDGTAYEKAMAKVIMSEYSKADAYRKTGENWYDFW